jgi:hypothetical protein
MCTGGNKFAKAIEFGAAKMAPGDKVRARAPLPQCLRVERHGVLAGTRHDGTLIGHHLSNLSPAQRRGLAVVRLPT